jgi:carbamoyl-phosphate synthase small subunit
MIPSRLILESGEIFSGVSPKWQTDVSYFGEVVFSTGMTGYVESLTDPSYAGQILTFTYPLIGNYGVPERNAWESEKIQATGVVLGSVSLTAFHRKSKSTFLDWLQSQNIPAIANVDTRELTRLLRKKGTVLGAICPLDKRPRKFPDPNQTNLVQKVSISEKKVYGSGPQKVIVVDCGMKEHILRCLSAFPIQVIRVPYNYDYSNDDFDGLLISNGPGDPSKCKETIAILRKNLKKQKPILGICLGAQLLGLAIDAKTYKLKFGHRGQNHPCQDLERKVSILTSQNHGYAIDEKTIPRDWKILFRSLNDGAVEGIAHRKLPFFAVQFHPEGHPGPTDGLYLFEKFYQMMNR